MPSISFLDSTGFATLTNGKNTPRVNAWTPKRVPIGPKATGLGTGRIHMFEFRTDDLVQFSLDNIPGTDANMQIMLRLQAHLLRGGIVTLDAGRTAYASNWGTCSLAPDTEPEIQFSDRDALEYSFVATLRTSAPSAADFYPALLPDLLLWLNGDDLVGNVDDGGLVPLWPDASGLDNDADQADNTKYPTFRETGGPNDHASVEFGGEKFLRTPDIAQPTDGTTVFVVMKRTGSFIQHGAFFSFGSTGDANGNDGASVLEQDEGAVQWFADQTASGYITLANADVTAWNIVTLNFQTTASATGWVNGQLGATFDPNGVIEGSGLDRFIVGAANGSGIYYGANCRIAEVLWYGANLSETDRNSVNTYLATKYDIALSAPTPLTDLTGFNWTTWIAADQEAFANNDPVGTATDFGANGNDATQATSGSRPLFKTNIINGLPAFLFDGTDDSLDFASGAFAGLSSGADIFVVLKTLSNSPLAAESGLWTMGTSGGVNSTHYRYTDNHVYDDAGSNTRRDYGIVATDLSTPHLYSIRTSATRIIAAHGFTTIMTAAPNTVGFSTVVSIGKSVNSVFFKGYIAELLIGPTLSLADRARVIEFLEAKYAL